MRQRRYLTVGLFGAMLLTGAAFASAKNNDANSGACAKTALVLRTACTTDLLVNFGEASANCLNISNAGMRKDCYATAQQDMADSRDECGAVYSERQVLCSAIGQAPYEPHFGAAYAANFVNPLDIGGSVAQNPYYPLKPGNKWVYYDDVSKETDVVEVTHQTKLIDGITCVVVHDVVSKGTFETEHTDDWFAQDRGGNVWYCGESSQQLETFPGDNPQTPELVAIDGSWKAGVNSAKAGIVMAANPQAGETRRLELSWGEAEDANEILSVNASESTPGAACTNTCIQTRDFTPLDAGSGEENKYYAPDVGVILEVEVETGERNELQAFTPGP